MKFTTASLLCAAATVASAIPMPPAGTCIVDLNGTPYNTLALRKQPCNNKAPSLYLSNGASVQQMSSTLYKGCGYTYYKVKYTDPSTGRTYKGYVGSDYVTCGSQPVPPTPPTPPSTQSCGQWSVAHGGPINACSTGYTYTAGNSDYCSGSNCQSICCSPAQDNTQSCGAWAVTLGGSPNACGSGWSYTAQDGDTCNANGSNCQSQCCTKLLY